jgi:hypothetical protein
MSPIGLNAFSLKPTLPDALDHLYLTNIKAYGGVFGVFLDKDGFQVKRANGEILAAGRYGDVVEVRL